ncbi:DUF3103 domain-containing protein [Vibrio caribbeanicus]|uniref:DUF3103 domain-containing protein n=1 Tax=Vibrio caribbeanicus TaxID=701175 RepID=UPI0030D9D9EC
MRSNLSTGFMLATALVGFQTNATIVNSEQVVAVPQAEKIAQQKRQLAIQFGTHYRELESSLKAQISEKNLSAPMENIRAVKPYSKLSRQMQKADHDYRVMKGVEQFTDSLIELRLADESMLEKWKMGESPLFAFEPSGDEADWKYIEAFDVNGNEYFLDVYQMPDRPVFVVDNDSSKEMRAGLEAMRAEMHRLGQKADLITNDKKPKFKKTKMMRAMVQDIEPLSTTQLTKISLDNDREPWISKAEIYAMVMGVNPDRAEPQIDMVEMPYLDDAKKDYYPNQTIIFWDRYRWGAADIILMEQDDKTNYKKLAQLVVELAEEILKNYPDPEVQGYAIIAQITNKILAALPDEWMINNDDYVDSYYTVMQDTPYVDRPGANGNAIATFEPVTIDPTH